MKQNRYSPLGVKCTMKFNKLSLFPKFVIKWNLARGLCFLHVNKEITMCKFLCIVLIFQPTWPFVQKRILAMGQRVWGMAGAIFNFTSSFITSLRCVKIGYTFLMWNSPVNHTCKHICNDCTLVQVLTALLIHVHWQCFLSDSPT